MITTIPAAAAPIMEVAGVWLLFRYGMPFRLPSPGGLTTVWLVKNETPNPDVIKEDRKHRNRGILGLVLIFTAAFVQVALALL